VLVRCVLRRRPTTEILCFFCQQLIILLCCQCYIGCKLCCSTLELCRSSNTDTDTAVFFWNTDTDVGIEKHRFKYGIPIPTQNTDTDPAVLYVRPLQTQFGTPGNVFDFQTVQRSGRVGSGHRVKELLVGSWVKSFDPVPCLTDAVTDRRTAHVEDAAGEVNALGRQRQPRAGTVQEDVDHVEAEPAFFQWTDDHLAVTRTPHAAHQSLGSPAVHRERMRSMGPLGSWEERLWNDVLKPYLKLEVPLSAMTLLVGWQEGHPAS